MIATLEHLLSLHHSALTEACGRFGVERLDLFGSATNDRFDSASSDLDFLVQFKPEARAQAFDNYFGLLECLTALFGRPVDLVTRSSVRNPYFVNSVEKNRRKLYVSGS